MPFEVPQSWCWTTLGEIFTLQAGKNIAAKEISDRQDETCPFPCYGGNGIRGYVSSHNRNGHFPIIGRQGALCGNINVADGLFYATEHAVVVETYCNIDIVWAANALTYLNLNQYATSTAQPGLSVSTINEVMIPLPPIKEQTRIVYSLNKWFVLIDTIESGKTDLRTTIKQTKSKILDLAIHGKLVPQDPNDEPASELLKRINSKAEITCDNGQYGKLPRSWSVTILGNLFEHNTGKALNSSNNEGVMLQYLTTSNVYWDTFDLSVIKQMLFKDSELERCTIRKGDLLVCEGGDVGRAAIWDYDYNICIQNHLHRLRPKADLPVRFYLYVLKYLKDNNMIGGKGIGLLGLSTNELHKLLFPLPPLAEQHRIVVKIEELFSKLDLIEKSLEA